MLKIEQPGLTRARTALAWACLATASAASGVLAMAHLHGSETPGCGPEGGCVRLLSGDWARLPGVGWPLAFLGLAYFPAMLGAWRVSQGRLGFGLSWVAILGGAISVVLSLLMGFLGAFCPWCLTVHAANLGFIAAARPRAAARSSTAVSLTFATTFAVLSIGLVVVGSVVGAAQQRGWESQRERSERAAATASRGGVQGFTGRYRLGPTTAVARIVLFLDYQCPLCAEIEGQAERLLASHPEVSLSVRHFPLDSGCNPTLRGQAGSHGPAGNSCRSARAAEAAGIVGGDPAFFAVHRWLAARRGVFGRIEELREVIEKAGVDFPRFLTARDSSEVDANIQADIQEATRLGLLSTPMVFVNGVELKGVRAEEALVRTVEGILSTAPPSSSSFADAPPPARLKVVADWEDGLRIELKDDPPRWPRGPASARVDVVVWGDYLSEESRSLDGWLRERLGKEPRFRYAFRHVPTGTPSLEAARAAEAGGRLGGAPGFWAVHAWLMRAQTPPDLDRLSEDLASSGIEHDRFLTARSSPEVTVRVRHDQAASERLGLDVGFVPLLIVNDRWVPRWRIGEEVVLDSILEAASRELGEGGR